MAGFLAAFVQVIGMLAFAVATILIGAFAMGTVPWLATFLFTLVGMAYAPLMGLVFPDRSGPA